MSKRNVFYSFHFRNDVFRVQQIRNMGVLEGNAPVAPNVWEEVKRKPGGVEKWIDDNMKYKSCVVVLVGSETSQRPWVQYEIQKAWIDGKGLVGIYIHNLKDPRTATEYPFMGKCPQGSNPFDRFLLNNFSSLSSVVTCYNPHPIDTYNDIKNSLEYLIEDAIRIRNNSSLLLL